MAKRDYIKKKNAEKAIWSGTYKTRIATHGATLGLTAGEITASQTDAQNIVDGVAEIDAAITAKESAVNAGTAKITGGEARIRITVKRIKTHPAYTDSIGQDLGVVGDEHSIDVPNSQPELTGTKDPSGWRLAFNLKGFFDGVNIYRQVPGEADYSFLALDTSSPYIDTEGAALKTGTSYYCFYVLSEREVGLRSNVVVI